MRTNIKKTLAVAILAVSSAASVFGTRLPPPPELELDENGCVSITHLEGFYGYSKLNYRNYFQTYSETEFTSGTIEFWFSRFGDDTEKASIYTNDGFLDQVDINADPQLNPNTYDIDNFDYFSFELTENMLSSINGDNGPYHGLFYYITHDTNDRYDWGDSAYIKEVRLNLCSAVPDSGSTLALLGLSTLGFIGLRRKFRK